MKTINKDETIEQVMELVDEIAQVKVKEQHWHDLSMNALKDDHMDLYAMRANDYEDKICKLKAQLIELI
jgi:hypothetical protein